MDEGVEWRPRLFRAVQGGPGGPDEGEEDLDWIINAEIDPHDPETAKKQILAITPIVKGQKQSTQFQIPPHQSKDSPAHLVSPTPGLDS